MTMQQRRSRQKSVAHKHRNNDVDPDVSNSNGPPQLSERHGSKVHLLAPPNVSTLPSVQENTAPAAGLAPPQVARP
ncbi:hypothetical protein EYF80_063336 [Liparis tanakae]|uniref:Uncharacterized protein n=1 Tax=Liparis tanakae TaxID=230148 RepID=A0A4Z2ECE8_9TELE|nr:hypothetical protein EYF80_063336 [Liparis tanakae]